jgi:hypothetical protein
MKLEERISLLPKCIQIHISEFNVEHRTLTQQLKQELFSIIYPLCRMCSAPFEKDFCTIDFFIIRKYHLYCHWCDMECFEKDSDRELKLKCLKAVKEYTEV